MLNAGLQPFFGGLISRPDPKDVKTWQFLYPAGTSTQLSPTDMAMAEDMGFVVPAGELRNVLLSAAELVDASIEKGQIPLDTKAEEVTARMNIPEGWQFEWAEEYKWLFDMHTDALGRQRIHWPQFKWTAGYKRLFDMQTTAQGSEHILLPEGEGQPQDVSMQLCDGKQQTSHDQNDNRDKASSPPPNASLDFDISPTMVQQPTRLAGTAVEPNSPSPIRAMLPSTSDEENGDDSDGEEPGWVGRHLGRGVAPPLPFVSQLEQGGKEQQPRRRAGRGRGSGRRAGMAGLTIATRLLSSVKKQRAGSSKGPGRARRSGRQAGRARGRGRSVGAGEEAGNVVVQAGQEGQRQWQSLLDGAVVTQRHETRTGRDVAGTSSSAHLSAPHTGLVSTAIRMVGVDFAPSPVVVLTTRPDSAPVFKPTPTTPVRASARPRSAPLFRSSDGGTAASQAALQAAAGSQGTSSSALLGGKLLASSPQAGARPKRSRAARAESQEASPCTQQLRRSRRLQETITDQEDEVLLPLPPPDCTDILVLMAYYKQKERLIQAGKWPQAQQVATSVASGGAATTRVMPDGRGIGSRDCIGPAAAAATSSAAASGVTAAKAGPGAHAAGAALALPGATPSVLMVPSPMRTFTMGSPATSPISPSRVRSTALLLQAMRGTPRPSPRGRMADDTTCVGAGDQGPGAASGSSLTADMAIGQDAGKHQVGVGGRLSLHPLADPHATTYATTLLTQQRPVDVALLEAEAQAMFATGSQPRTSQLDQQQQPASTAACMIRQERTVSGPSQSWAQQQPKQQQQQQHREESMPAAVPLQDATQTRTGPVPMPVDQQHQPQQAGGLTRLNPCQVLGDQQQRQQAGRLVTTLAGVGLSPRHTPGGPLSMPGSGPMLTCPRPSPRQAPGMPVSIPGQGVLHWEDASSQPVADLDSDVLDDELLMAECEDLDWGFPPDFQFEYVPMPLQPQPLQGTQKQMATAQLGDLSNTTVPGGTQLVPASTTVGHLLSSREVLTASTNGVTTGGDPSSTRVPMVGACGVPAASGIMAGCNPSATAVQSSRVNEATGDLQRQNPLVQQDGVGLGDPAGKQAGSGTLNCANLEASAQLAAEKQQLLVAQQQLFQQQQQLLLDQQQLAAVKAQLLAGQQQLERDVHKCKTDKQQLQSEQQQLTALRQELQVEQQQLTVKQQQAAAEWQGLKAEKQQLMADVQQLGGEKQQLTAEKQQLSTELEMVKAQLARVREVAMKAQGLLAESQLRQRQSAQAITTQGATAQGQPSQDGAAQPMADQAASTQDDASQETSNQHGHVHDMEHALSTPSPSHPLPRGDKPPLPPTQAEAREHAAPSQGKRPLDSGQAAASATVPSTIPAPALDQRSNVPATHLAKEADTFAKGEIGQKMQASNAPCAVVHGKQGSESGSAATCYGPTLAPGVAAASSQPAVVQFPPAGALSAAESQAAASGQQGCQQLTPEQQLHLLRYVQQLKQQLAEVKQREQQLKQQTTEQLQREMSAQKELHKLLQSLAHNEKEMLRLKACMVSLETERDGLATERDQLVTEYAEVMAVQEQQLGEERAQASAEKQALKQELEKQAKQAADDKQALQQEVASAREQLVPLAAALAQAQLQKEAVQAECGTLQEKLIQQEQQLQAAASAASAAQGQLQQLQQRCQDLQDQKQQLEDERQGLQDQLAQAKGVLQFTQTELERLQGAHAQLKAELGEARVTHQHLQAQLAEMQHAPPPPPPPPPSAAAAASASLQGEESPHAAHQTDGPSLPLGAQLAQPCKVTGHQGAGIGQAGHSSREVPAGPELQQQGGFEVQQAQRPLELSAHAQQHAAQQVQQGKQEGAAISISKVAAGDDDSDSEGPALFNPVNVSADGMPADSRQTTSQQQAQPVASCPPTCPTPPPTPFDLPLPPHLNAVQLSLSLPPHLSVVAAGLQLVPAVMQLQAPAAGTAEGNAQMERAAVEEKDGTQLQDVANNTVRGEVAAGSHTAGHAMPLAGRATPAAAPAAAAAGSAAASGQGMDVDGLSSRVQQAEASGVLQMDALAGNSTPQKRRQRPWDNVEGVAGAEHAQRDGGGARRMLFEQAQSSDGGMQSSSIESGPPEFEPEEDEQQDVVSSSPAKRSRLALQAADKQRTGAAVMLDADMADMQPAASEPDARAALQDVRPENAAVHESAGCSPQHSSRGPSAGGPSASDGERSGGSEGEGRGQAEGVEVWVAEGQEDITVDGEGEKLVETQGKPQGELQGEPHGEGMAGPQGDGHGGGEREGLAGPQRGELAEHEGEDMGEAEAAGEGLGEEQDDFLSIFSLAGNDDEETGEQSEHSMDSPEPTPETNSAEALDENKQQAGQRQGSPQPHTADVLGTDVAILPEQRGRSQLAGLTNGVRQQACVGDARVERGRPNRHQEADAAHEQHAQREWGRSGQRGEPGATHSKGPQPQAAAGSHSEGDYDRSRKRKQSDVMQENSVLSGLANSHHVPWRLFVGRAPFHFQEEDLRALFSPWGTIQELRLLRQPDGKSRGCAYVTYTEREMAEKAIQELDGCTHHANVSNWKLPLIVKFADADRTSRHAASQSTAEHAGKEQQPVRMGRAASAQRPAGDGDPNRIERMSRSCSVGRHVPYNGLERTRSHGASQRQYRAASADRSHGRNQQQQWARGDAVAQAPDQGWRGQETETARNRQELGSSYQPRQSSPVYSQPQQSSRRTEPAYQHPRCCGPEVWEPQPCYSQTQRHSGAEASNAQQRSYQARMHAGSAALDSSQNSRYPGSPAGGVSQSHGREVPQLDRKPWQLWVGNIPLQWDIEELRPLFTPFGTIQDLSFVRKSGAYSRCAFVTYASREEAARAIRALHLNPPGDNSRGALKVQFAQPSAKGGAGDGEPAHQPPQINSNPHQHRPPNTLHSGVPSTSYQRHENGSHQREHDGLHQGYEIGMRQRHDSGLHQRRGSSMQQHAHHPYHRPM